jgi:hypothetical protein
MYTVHDLTSLSMSEAYDATQYCRHIEDGDVLIVEDGLAVMMKAWPTMVEGQSTVFHRLADGYTFDDVFTEDGDDYRAQVAEIRANPDALRARALDTVAEIREDERAELADWDQRTQNMLDDA